MYNALSFDNANSAKTLYARDEQGQYQVATPAQILATARLSADRLLEGRVSCNKPHLVKDFLIGKLAGMEHEVAACLFLDNQLALIEYQEMFNGTISQASVYPREIAKVALRLNAAAVVMAHNHPSGIAEPSDADRALTKHLKKSLNMLDVRLVDHIIVAGTRTASFAERGIL